MRYEIRAATRADHDQLYALSEHLNSVNLPHDGEEIEELLSLSERSFSGEIADPLHRTYVFVLRDLELDVAVGTSMLIAQLGSRDAPYIFFDVGKEEWYSRTLDKLFVHPVLSIGYSYHGPTEIGGLVVDPKRRRDPARLGMLISYVRFLFIKAARDRFQNRVLAELMPPLGPDRTSHLWEAVGRHFTGMSYHDADRLSKRNKEFIRGLFPRGDIYVSLLPPEAQAVVGEVGPETKGVAKMLTRIGFEYWDRVDPFDGGPHYVAATDEITLVERTEQRVTHRSDGAMPPDARRVLVARLSDGPPYAHVIPAQAIDLPDGAIKIETAAFDRLGLQTNEITWVLPLY